MTACDVTVLPVPGCRACPVEKREIQQAVNDEAVFLPILKAAPGLDELPLLMKAGDEVVCGKEGCLPARLTACVLVCGDA